MSSINPRTAPVQQSGSVRSPLLLWFLLLAAAICGYSLWVGPIGFWGDSYLFADRAKHLFHQGNLDLNNHGNLIYPPLYSIVLAPLYALNGAAAILTAITMLNSLFVASTLFPVYWLVTHYAGVTTRDRWFFSLLIIASPAFLSYAPMVLSEAFFFPLVYWTAYTVFRSLTDLTPGWFLSAGLLMATGLLTRSAATGLFLAGCGAWLLSLCFFAPVKPLKAATLLLTGIVAFMLPILAWHVFEKNHVAYQGGVEYSITTALRSLLASRPDQIIKLHWTLNAIFYFLTAPLNLGAFLALALLIRRPGTAFRDPLIPFAFAVIALAVASIVILAPTSYGGNPLTWNKYFAPFVGLITIITLRFRPQFTRKEVLIALAAAFALPWLGLPSGLVCHFPDALSPFIDSARQLPAASWMRDGLFFLLLGGTACLFVPSVSSRARVTAAVIAVGLGLFSTVASALYWRNSGLLNLKHYDGLAVRLQEARQATPDLPVFYDPNITRNDPGEAHRFLFYYPALLRSLPQASLFLDGPDPALPGRFLYITRAILPSAHLRAKDGETLRLYEVDGSQIRHDLAYRIKYGKDVGGQETITVDGRSVPVRWLSAEAEISILVEQAIPQAQLGLRLAICDHPRKVIATLNGQLLEEQPAITRVPWQNGFDYVAWSVPLTAGENRLTLRNDSEPVTLPDGVRKVTFLLIDEPVVSKP